MPVDDGRAARGSPRPSRRWACVRGAHRRRSRRPSRRRRRDLGRRRSARAEPRCRASASRCCRATSRAASGTSRPCSTPSPTSSPTTSRRCRGCTRPDPAGVRLRALARRAPVREALPCGPDHQVQPHPRDGRATRRGRRGMRRSRTQGSTSSRWASTCSRRRSTCRCTGGSIRRSSPSTRGRAGRSGIPHVEAGPLVRSSYHAGRQLRRAVDAGVLSAPER